MISAALGQGIIKRGELVATTNGMHGTQKGKTITFK